MDEHTYEEELKLASDRDLFNKCCIYLKLISDGLL